MNSDFISFNGQKYKKVGLKSIKDSFYGGDDALAHIKDAIELRKPFDFTNKRFVKKLTNSIAEYYVYSSINYLISMMKTFSMYNGEIDKFKYVKIFLKVESDGLLIMIHYHYSLDGNNPIHDRVCISQRVPFTIAHNTFFTHDIVNEIISLFNKLFHMRINKSINIYMYSWRISPYLEE